MTDTETLQQIAETLELISTQNWAMVYMQMGMLTALGVYAEHATRGHPATADQINDVVTDALTEAGKSIMLKTDFGPKQ